MEGSDAVSPANVLNFWFGSGSDPEAVRHGRNLWWRGSPRLDSDIDRRFRRAVIAGGSGRLDVWGSESSGRLALILLLDQFSRHIWRGRPEAFANDHLARDRTREGLRLHQDEDLTPVRRAFFYMPLQHSEAIIDQERSVACYRALASDATPDTRKALEGFLKHAVDHRDLIVRFGRFPHRNEILGRTSTEAEKRFLAVDGERFRIRVRGNRE